MYLFGRPAEMSDAFLVPSLCFTLFCWHSFLLLHSWLNKLIDCDWYDAFSRHRELPTTILVTICDGAAASEFIHSFLIHRFISKSAVHTPQKTTHNENKW